MQGLQSHRGYILITTLLLIMIMSLLLMTRLQGLLLFSKMTSRLSEYHQDFYDLETQARLLAKKPIQSIDARCVRKRVNSEPLSALLKQKKACLFQDKAAVYPFLIEDLGVEPCLLIRKKKGLYSAHHWRYSIAFYKNEEWPSGLQFTVFKPELSGRCEGKEKIIQSGIRTWRYLDRVLEDPHFSPEVSEYGRQQGR